MATENVSKLIPFVMVGAPAGQVSVSKLVAYAIVNGNTPGPPPVSVRRQAASILYGKTRASG